MSTHIPIIFRDFYLFSPLNRMKPNDFFFHVCPRNGPKVTHCHFLTRFCHLLRTALENDANIISGFPMIYTYGLCLGFVISAFRHFFCIQMKKNHWPWFHEPREVLESPSRDAYTLPIPLGFISVFSMDHTLTMSDCYDYS